MQQKALERKGGRKGSSTKLANILNELTADSVGNKRKSKIPTEGAAPKSNKSTVSSRKQVQPKKRSKSTHKPGLPDKKMAEIMAFAGFGSQPLPSAIHNDASVPKKIPDTSGLTQTAQESQSSPCSQSNSIHVRTTLTAISYMH